METATENLELTEPNNFNSCVGILDVYIHEARDLHNICIYHEQDVYATVYLTSDPETRVSTKIINGGGRNPVFNQNLRLNIKKMMVESSSLRCEIWMLSRIKNYLEDQLLGFVVIDINSPEIVFKNRGLPLEYELSSCDLLHVPAGLVKLTLNYEGILPQHEHPRMESRKQEKSSVSRQSAHEKLDSKLGASVEEIREVGGKRVMMKDEEKAVVQEEIMEVYMKSMMEATEAMVNIKLPSEGVVLESGLDNYVETDERFPESKNKGTNSRVFYGSRAFF